MKAISTSTDNTQPNAPTLPTPPADRIPWPTTEEEWADALKPFVARAEQAFRSGAMDVIIANRRRNERTNRK